VRKGPKHLDRCACKDSDIDQEELCSCGAHDRWREELRKDGWRKLPSAREKDGALYADGFAWVYIGQGETPIPAGEEPKEFAGLPERLQPR
jgi:hypothetical protein